MVRDSCADRTAATLSRRRLLAYGGLLTGAMLIAGATQGPATAQAAALRREPLAIVTPNGRFLFTVEVADTTEDQHRGLMGRRDVPPETGMLFNFGPPRPVSMWMHDTPVSLDMLFIRADGTVIGIAANTVPNSDTIIPSPEPVVAVLELAAGTAEHLGIGPGARVEHRIFASGRGLK